MDQTEFKSLHIDEMNKCALIYRSNSATFIYVCHHCGLTFDAIDCTLEHIETHFQFPKITINTKPGCNDSMNDELIDDSQIQPEPTVIDIVIKSEEECAENVDLNVADPMPGVEETEATQFQCTLCNAVFSSKFLLRSHALLVHFNEETLECDKCSKKFKRKLLFFERHLNEHMVRGEVSWSCTGDGIRKPFHIKWSESKSESHENVATLTSVLETKSSGTDNVIKKLKKQIQNRSKSNGNRTFECHKCSETYSTANDLKNHIDSHPTDVILPIPNVEESITHVSESEYHCKLCTETFQSKTNLNTHVKAEHSEQHELHCGQCDSTFTLLKYYYAHQLEHQRVGANITENEIVLYRNLISLIDENFVYDKEANDENPFRCLPCNSRFNSQINVRRHVRRRHIYKMLPEPDTPNISKEVTCDTCDKKFNRKWIKQHMLTHTDIKLHTCSTCGRKFRNKPSKVAHERLHTGERPYQCHECGKRFQTNSLLTAHKKYHDSTTYPCKICGREFNMPSSLRRHVQTHRKDKAFQCTICLQSFNTRVYLTRHMFKHSAKNYQCTFCKEKFNTAIGKRHHERMKHSYEPELS